MLAADGALVPGAVWDSAAAAAMDQINSEALTANQVSARTIRRARPTALIALPLDASIRQFRAPAALNYTHFGLGG